MMKSLGHRENDMDKIKLILGASKETSYGI